MARATRYYMATYSTAGYYTVSRALGGGLAILYIGAVMFSLPQLASIRMFKTVFLIMFSTRLLKAVGNKLENSRIACKYAGIRL